MKSFFLYFGIVMAMFGLWVKVGTTQTITATDMPDANLRAKVLAQLKAVSIVAATATDFTQANMADSRFTELDAVVGIADITGLEYATNLTRLNLFFNVNTNLSDISAVSGLTNLTNLNLGSNKISNISAVSGLTNLTNLNLGGNNISNISAVSKLTNLTNLNLGSNKISNISAVSGLTNLTNLNLASNNISNISAVSGLTNLTNLDVAYNNLSNISAVSGLTNLTHLRLASNNISNISAVSKLINLTDLYLEVNRISDISAVSNLRSLTLLYLTKNRISSTAAIVGLTELNVLELGDNRITDVAEFVKLRSLNNISTHPYRGLHLDNSGNNHISLVKNNDEAALRDFLWVRPSSIDAEQAVTSENYLQNPPMETIPFTIRFSEPVYEFEMEDIIVETDLHTGTGTATLAALTPTTEPAQIYTATLLLPSNAAGALRVIVRAEAAETDAGRIDPAVDRVFPWIAFSTLPPPPRKRKIVFQCPVGWQRTDSFARKTQRVIIYEVNLEMDLHNRVSIYKPTSVVIYVHPDEALENLDGWKLKVAVPYNHHREYLLTTENAVVVDSQIEGVEGGFAFIESPEEAPFPMVAMGFTGVTVPGFDYRLYDDQGRKVDFGIACYKQVGIFQVLKDMEDPRVLRNVPLETLDWDVPYIRSEWTVPVPAPAAPSLVEKTVVGTWAALKKQ